MSQKVKYPKAFIKFIWEISSQVITGSGEKWAYMPFWLKLDKDPCVVEEYGFDELPEDLLKTIRGNRGELEQRSDKITLLERFALFLEKDSAHQVAFFVYEKDLVNYAVIHFEDSIHVEQKAKPVIVETLVVILFIVGLLSIRIHFLESVIEKVAVL